MVQSPGLAAGLRSPPFCKLLFATGCSWVPSKGAIAWPFPSLNPKKPRCKLQQSKTSAGGKSDNSTEQRTHFSDSILK